MKATAVCYIFQSDSNADKTYQALLYVDGSTSCDCKGWTRRVQPDGSRFCKHTRLIAAGLAEREAVKVIKYADITRPRMVLMPTRPAPAIPPGPKDPAFGILKKRKATTPDEPTTRKFDFDA